jgi:hypothetical protein
MDIRMKPSEECAKEAGAIAYSEVFASKYGRRYEYEGEDDPLHQGANSCTCAQDFCACVHCPKTQESFT